MSTPGNTPPTDARSGRIAAMRDSYRKPKVPPEGGEREPWYKFKRRAKD